MGYSTSECAWAQTKIKVLQRTVTGLRGFEFKKTVEKEHIYAAGADPIDIQSGNNKYEGSLKLLKFELDLLNEAAQAAGYEDITQVPHNLILITCAYKKDAVTPMRVTEAQGVAFTEIAEAMEQGAKMMEVSLPFLATKIVHK